MYKKVAWWDKLGNPQYGGEMVIRANRNIADFDPYSPLLPHIFSAWMEKLFTDDWTMDPDIFDYKAHWRPSQYVKGFLAERWEFTDMTTFVVHLRKGIHWQDIPPACGREFNADDVVFHYNRLCGLDGFRKPSPLHKAFKDLNSVVAADKYTIVFKWKTPNPELIMETLFQISPATCIENPETVKKWGNLDNWQHAIGTGPFVLTNFIPGKSATLTKCPNYWGYDERYPKNRLPYLDTVKYSMIPDEAEAVDAMRAGKLDIIDHISPMQVQAITRTNPEILQFTHPDSNAFSIDPRNDVKPFNDIRVRIAMQMAIDLPTIAKMHYHGAVEPYPATLTSRYMKGWGFPYEEWPQALKDEYAYNPNEAKKLLTEAGYPNGFKTNIIAEADSDEKLLQIIKSYFAQVGIGMEIRILQTARWIVFVQTDHKQDQLAHHRSGPLGHTSAPICDLTRFQKNGWGNWMMVDDPAISSFLSDALSSTTIDDMKFVMRKANEYVARKHFTISVLQPEAYSLCQPWVKGFTGQFGSAWAHSVGPAMLSFYLGRFWIDRNLK
jgi:peptide/nickel transport system substrate-binding protein